MIEGLSIQYWPTEKLIPYARNPRKNDSHVDRMASAIREFGFRIPIVAKSDGSVVDGHLRLKAARKLDLETVPVVLADDLTPAQIKAFRILANKSVEWAEWDNDLLRVEMEELRDLGVDLELTGFDVESIDVLLNDISIVDNSGLDDDRGNRTEPGKSGMVVSIGTMSAVVDYDLVQSIMDAIKHKFGEQDGIKHFCAWVNESIAPIS